MKGATEFLDQVQNNPEFIKRALACATDAERKVFLRQEGFEFDPDEFEAALSSWAFFDNLKYVGMAKDFRKTKRYDVFLKVAEINGQPVNDTVILDISTWGARIESMARLLPDSPVVLSFPLPGEEKEPHVRLLAKVVWAGEISISKRNHAGLKFYNALDQLNREGKPLSEKVKGDPGAARSPRGKGILKHQRICREGRRPLVHGMAVDGGEADSIQTNQVRVQNSHPCLGIT